MDIWKPLFLLPHLGVAVGLVCFGAPVAVSPGTVFADITWEKSVSGTLDRRVEVLKKFVKANPGQYDSSYARYSIAVLYLSKLTGQDYGIAKANRVLQRITTDFPTVKEGGYYWAITYDIRTYYLFKNRPDLLYPATRDGLRRRLWKYVKARSFRKNAVDAWHFWSTENHMMWKGSTFLLAAQMFREKIYADGAPGSSHYEYWNSWFSQWMDERARKGWLEISSPHYQIRSMAGIINVYDFGEDKILRKKVEMTLDWLWADYAQESIKGVRGGAKVRTYFRNAKGIYQGMRCAAYILFGVGSYHQHGLGSVHVATSRYQPPNAVTDLAIDRWGRGTYVIKERRPSTARKYTYVTPDFILGAFQDNDRYSALGNDRWVGLIFATSPEARIYLWGRKGGDSARGQQDLSHEKYFQHKNVIIAEIGQASKSYPTMIYFSGALDKIDEESGWVFVSEGSAYAAFKSVLGKYHWSGKYLVSDNTGTPVILEAARWVDYGSFTAFKSEIKDRYLSYSQGVLKYETREGDQIQVDFDNPKINGESVDLESYKLFDSPYIQSDWDSGYIKVQKGNRYLILDFTDPDNPRKTEGVLLTPNSIKESTPG